MLTKDWNYMLKHRKYSDKEEALIVSNEEFMKLKKQMDEQDKDSDIHILGMNYTFSTGQLTIKRRYFK